MLQNYHKKSENLLQRPQHGKSIEVHNSPSVLVLQTGKSGWQITMILPASLSPNPSSKGSSMAVVKQGITVDLIFLPCIKHALFQFYLYDNVQG